MCRKMYRVDNRKEASIVYHQRWGQHGPTGIAPAYNLLVSVPEKCATEWWFFILEYLNFPQDGWPRGREYNQMKNVQRQHLVPMLYDLPGAAQHIKDEGITIAVVRHPFVRLYSGTFLTYRNHE